ncbi:MAG: FtsX-like permease family protein [Planctomycetota bacterium]
MTHVFLLAWRHFAGRPARAITSVVGVGLGLATVLAVLTIDHNTILTMSQRAAPPLANQDIEIRPLRPNPPDLAALRERLNARTDLTAVAGLFFALADLETGAGHHREDIRLCAIEPGGGASLGAYALGDGEDLSQPREVLLSRAIARDLKVRVGDTITLRRTSPKIRGCVGGEMVTMGSDAAPGSEWSVRVCGILAPLNLGTQPVVVMAFAEGLELYAGTHIQPMFWGKLEPGAVYQDVRAELKEWFAVEKPKRALVGERVDQRAFRKGLRLSAFLSLFLGLFVIYNAFSMSLVERIKTIGLLRAIGLTTRELHAVFLIEGLLIGVLGVAAGFLLASLLVVMMKSLGVTSLGYGKPIRILEIPWRELLAIGALGVLSSLLGVVVPLRRAARLSVVEALRAGRASVRRPHRLMRAVLFVGIASSLPLLYLLASPPLGENQRRVLYWVVIASGLLAAVLVTLVLFPGATYAALELLLRPVARKLALETRLALASLSGAEHRVFASVTGLMLVFAGILLISTVTQSLKEETEQFVDRAIGSTVFVKVRPMAKAAVLEAASRVGVNDLCSVSAQVQSPFLIRGAATSPLAEAVPILRDAQTAEAFEQGKTIVLSTLLARSFGYRLGDEVRLSTFSGARAVHVAAISDAFGFFPDDRVFALMSPRAMKELFCVDDSEGTSYIVRARNDGAAAAVKERLQAALGADAVQWVRTGDDVRQLYRDDMSHDFLIFDIILLLTALLASVGMLNSFTIAIIQRRREIGLLRAVGVTLQELQRMLMLEALALAILGGVLALALGLPLTVLAVRSIRVLSQLDVPLALAARILAMPLAGSLLVAVVGCALPLLRVKRLDIAAATKYE